LKSGVLPDDLKLEGPKKEEAAEEDEDAAEPALKQAKTA